jgi:glycosyltransferase involved in cell wall biosynthesis
MYVPDEEMLLRFDACVGLSKATERYFSPRRVPFMWMPGGCTPNRALNGSPLAEAAARIQFGYFGAVGAHAGVEQLIEVFLRNSRDTTLEICGYGKASEKFAELSRQTPNVKFRGLLTPAECLQFGRRCDVLVNPRPATHGNENNFASKLFEYALSGRAILTSKLSGVEDVLGPGANYFDPHDFDRSLAAQLEQLARTPPGRTASSRCLNPKKSHSGILLGNPRAPPGRLPQSRVRSKLSVGSTRRGAGYIIFYPRQSL